MAKLLTPEEVAIAKQGDPYILLILHNTNIVVWGKLSSDGSDRVLK